MQKLHSSRETWLQAATELLRPLILEQGQTLIDDIPVSMGFPKGSTKAIGQCFGPENNSIIEDLKPSIFICPTQDDPMKILGILLHELIHAAVGCECGHKGMFKTVAISLGLAGKMTHTYVEENSDLFKRLEEMVEKLGVFPHSALKKPMKNTDPTAWVRLQSISESNYRVVISPKMLEAHGFPVDPWGEEMKIIEKGGSDA